ncbi:hypothetical protein QS468_55500 [Bacillus subtilis]|jgi:hypothetical protein|nr:hypothetical protein [Pseudomonas sp. A29(2023)]MDL5602007.1 hypothetical protein [Bacillus subtilis]
MSLQQAKKIADIKEEIAIASNKLGAQRDGFRKKIDDEVLSSFTLHLESNGFKVTKSAKGAEATYKDLKINLILAGPEERYIGVFHSFSISVNGKKSEVTVVASLTGVPDRPVMRSGDAVQILEEDLQLLNGEVENIQMVGYKFDCGQRVASKQYRPVMKDTVAEVIDVFSA